LQSVSTSDDFDNADGLINSNNTHELGSFDGSGQFLDGYLSDVHFIDGQALDATSFGQFTNGYWEAKDYAGTYGTNGFHLTFEDDVVSEGFNAVTYRGDGSNGNSISGLGFSPDLTWFKRRDAAGYYHELHDTIRGADKALFSNATDAESTRDSQISFDSDGFTVGTQSGAHGGTNTSGGSYVAWAWDAGSGSAASNTDGSITSTVKANPAYGFSIVSYTGSGANATVGHGLSSAPEMVIIKKRNVATNWMVYNQTVGNNRFLYLDLTNSQTGTDSTYWNNTSPTSSVIHLGTYHRNNSASEPYIAYCFSSVAGYSSIGSYTGNGSASGPTVTTGFPVAFVMIKRTDDVGGWYLKDNTRNPSGEQTLFLDASDADAEATGAQVTFSSTGFQVTNPDAGTNASGGTYIYMAFADTREAAFWKDVSGQGNHWTPNNLDYRDSLPDSPANNFAVLNAVDKGNNVTLSEGNLAATLVADDAVRSTFHFDIDGSESWYAEMYISGTPNSSSGIGIVTSTASMDAAGGNAETYWYFANGNKRNVSEVSYGATYTAGDVIGVSVTGGAVTFYKNGSSQGVAFSGLTGSFAFAVAEFNGTSTKFIYNFGQDSTFSGAKPMGAYTDDSELGTFQHQPPAAFKSLCSANLPTPTIISGAEHFNTVLWTGNSTNNTAITGVGFQSDFVWIKQRSSVEWHRLHDTVRGVSQQLYSNGTNAEVTATNNLLSVDSDGFTLGTDSAVNGSGFTYVGWNWKAGGTAVSNTDGSITSQVSANVDAGFSIVSYTGTGVDGDTVGHGLTASEPELVIIKGRTGAGYPWAVYGYPNNSAFPNDGSVVYLNDTAAMTDSTGSELSLGASTISFVDSGANINGSGQDYICYAFHSVEGYSKAGSYTGNGSSDGPMVFTGGRPAWFLVKRSDSGTHHWRLFDAVRSTFNDVDDYLAPSNSNAEAVGKDVDFVSNGIKIRTSNSDLNLSGGTYIYLCIMESPQKFANAR